MVIFNRLKFDISNSCIKCGGLNEIIKTKGGDYQYYCDCFPCGSKEIKPFIKKVEPLKVRAYRWTDQNTKNKYKYLNI